MRLRLFVVLATTYLIVASREPPWTDAHVMWDTAKAVVDLHRLDITLEAGPEFFVIRGGKKYALNAPGNIVALMPSYFLYKQLARIPRAPRVFLEHFSCHVSSSLLAAGACVIFFGLARREGATERIALCLSLALGLLTIVFVYARAPWSEALQTFALVWLLDRAFALDARRSFSQGALLGVAGGVLIATKAVNLLVVAVVGLYVIVRHWQRGRELLVAVAGTVVGGLPFALLLGAFNRVRTGSWMDAGYGKNIFGGHIAAGLYGFLISPQKSIFVFSPLLVLGILAFPSYLRERRAHALLLAAVFLAIVLPHAAFHLWEGGWCWGPRYLVSVTPVVLLPVARWIGPWLAGVGWRRARYGLVVGLCAVSLYVQLIGSAVYWDTFIRLSCVTTGAPIRDYIPPSSAVYGHSWILAKYIESGSQPPEATPWGKQPHNTPESMKSPWGWVRIDWWMLDATGAAAWWGWGMLILLAGALMWAVMTLRPKRLQF